MEQQIHDRYPLLLAANKSGKNIRKAVQEIGMSRSTFYKYRWMAEMKIVDPQHYHQLRDQFISSGKLSEVCKEALTDEDGYGRTGTQMRLNKELLPLSGGN